MKNKNCLTGSYNTIEGADEISKQLHSKYNYVINFSSYYCIICKSFHVGKNGGRLKNSQRLKILIDKFGLEEGRRINLDIKNRNKC